MSSLRAKSYDLEQVKALSAFAEAAMKFSTHTVGLEIQKTWSDRAGSALSAAWFMLAKDQ